MKRKYIVLGCLCVLLVTCVIGYTWMERQKRVHEEKYLLEIKARVAERKKLYFQHKEAFHYIQAAFFSKTVSETENIYISLENQEPSIKSLNDNNESNALRDQLLQDKQFQMHVATLLNSGLK